MKNKKNYFKSMYCGLGLLLCAGVILPTMVSAATAPKSVQADMHLVPGKTISKRFYAPPELAAAGAILVEPKSKKKLPASMVRTRLQRGTERAKGSNGKTLQRKYLEVSVSVNPKIPQGMYYLFLVDKNGKSVRVRDRNSGKMVISRPTFLAIGNTPKTVTANKDLPSKQPSLGTPTRPGQLANGNIRDMERGEQVSSRTGGRTMPGENLESLAGGGRLLGAGLQIRADLAAKMGQWPGGGWTAQIGGNPRQQKGIEPISLGGAGAGGQAGDARNALLGGTSERSQTDAASRSPGRIGSSRDSQLMQGTTYHIQSSSTDRMSSNGTQRVQDDLKVKDSDGGSFSHSMSHETKEDGTVVESQSARQDNADGSSETEDVVTVHHKDGSSTTTSKSSSTDKDGNKTEKETVTKKDSKGNTTTKSKTTKTDSKGNTVTESSDSSTTSPEDGGCHTASCEAGMAWIYGFLGAVRTNRIDFHQHSQDSVMRPSGSSSSGKGNRSDFEMDTRTLMKKRVRNQILTDDADQGGGPDIQPSSSPVRPGGFDPGTVVDPLKGDGGDPGSTPRTGTGGGTGTDPDH